MRMNKSKNLPSIEVAVFCHQVAMILKSGIPLYEGMEILYRNYQETIYATSFEKIYEGVKSGGTLYAGLKAAEGFPAYMMQMVQIGEMTGKVDDVLEVLGNYYEKEDRLQSSIRSAVAYPMVLIVMMAAVISILVIKVLPIFSEVFKSMGADLSETSTIFLTTSFWIGKVVLGVIILFLFAMIAVFLLWRLGGKKKLLKIGCKIFPPLKKLVKKQTAQRFATVISMVLFSGYSLENALDLLPDLFSSEDSEEKVRLCKKLMSESVSFQEVIEQIDLFVPLHQKMIRVGADAGQTDQVMQKVAEMLEEEVEEDINALVGWIEPALVGLLTVIIGGILLSVMLPLISILSSIG